MCKIYGIKVWIIIYKQWRNPIEKEPLKGHLWRDITFKMLVQPSLVIRKIKCSLCLFFLPKKKKENCKSVSILLEQTSQYFFQNSNIKFTSNSIVNLLMGVCTECKVRNTWLSSC